MKMNYFFGIVFAFLGTACLSNCSVNKANIDESLKSHFDSAKVKGCFTLLDNASGEITVYNMSMDTARKLPSSTFHIIPALVGLETGFISSENELIQIDSPKYNTWKGKNPLDLKTAFQWHVDPFFSSVLEKMGIDTFKQWIDSIGYGNKSIGAAEEGFWMNNQLKISPDEQLGLMKKLYFDQLRFRKSVQETVRNLMLKEDNNAYRLSYISAKGMDEKNNQIGWICGWIEENKHVFFFVTMVDAGKQKIDAEIATEKITRNILSKYGFFLGKK
jgi:beta-lactamase class D